MKKYIGLFAVVALLTACNNDEPKTDNENAADTVNTVDKAQEKMNEIIDSAQSKGAVIADTLTNKVIEPAKKEAGKVGKKLKEKLEEARESINQ
jgi:polyhydroxyalkanoate synthesis regulator phasin